VYLNKVSTSDNFLYGNSGKVCWYNERMNEVNFFLSFCFVIFENSCNDTQIKSLYAISKYV